MSADGRWLLGDGRDANPSGVDLVSVDEETGDFRQVVRLHRNLGQIAADPSGRWWTLGGDLYPFDLGQGDSRGPLANDTSPVRSFRGSPVAIHPGRDLAVSVSEDGGALAFQAFSGGEKSKLLDLGIGKSETGQPVKPAPGLRPDNPRRLAARNIKGAANGNACLAFDLAHDRLVYATESRAYVVAIDTELAAASPRLAIVGSPKLKVVMDQTRRVRLAVADGGNATWTVDSMAAFARLQGNELVISPTLANLGHHHITVKAVRGGLSDTLTITLDVAAPSLDLGFQIDEVVLDRAGKTAVTWGRQGSQRFNYEPDGANEPTQFALIDLDAMKILATEPLKAGLQFAALDDRYLYMTLFSGNVLCRFDRSDLSVRKRVLLDGRPTQMNALPNGKLAIRVSVRRTSAPWKSTMAKR